MFRTKDEYSNTNKLDLRPMTSYQQSRQIRFEDDVIAQEPIFIHTLSRKKDKLQYFYGPYENKERTELQLLEDQ